MMTFSQELADRVRDMATRNGHFTWDADEVLAWVFKDATGQFADLWIEAEREEVRKAEEAVSREL